MHPVYQLLAPLWSLRLEIEKEVNALTATQQRLDAFFAVPSDREEEIAILADLHRRLITLIGTNQRVLEVIYELAALTDQLRVRRE